MHCGKTSTGRVPKIGFGGNIVERQFGLGWRHRTCVTCLMLLRRSGLFLGYALGHLIAYGRVRSFDVLLYIVKSLNVILLLLFTLANC